MDNRYVKAVLRTKKVRVRVSKEKEYRKEIADKKISIFQEKSHRPLHGEEHTLHSVWLG
jgi:hypothetical protein